MCGKDVGAGLHELVPWTVLRSASTTLFSPYLSNVHFNARRPGFCFLHSGKLVTFGVVTLEI